ncbi:cyclic-phosphate processing receiver domain-containing protein [Micromonospora chalcea]|uniref:cyclic-phosphate processing receiver domain-containing protein n=1 Tax=Micromonospora TaxID=1873 RepID=UPI00248B6E6B|nr:cyclic-phosphate processing receiver domain-containing protein [Micromonospora sp. WMMC264]WBB88332.1 hypothetical protein O7542_06205 [Micromonospora sp. WMMC264]
MGARRTIVLVDDLRSFVDGRSAEVARTSAAGVELLDRNRDRHLDELWLDHDLGGDDTIWPVVEVLERAVFDKRPFDVGVIYIHSANPAGAAKVAQVLRRWGYRVRVASGSTAVGYLDGVAELIDSNASPHGFHAGGDEPGRR